MMKGQLKNEVVAIENMLADVLREAKRINGEDRLVGKISVGYFSTLFRNRVIICDDSWGLLNIILHSRGVPYTPTIEFQSIENGLLGDSILHFETVWAFSQQMALTKEIN